MVFQNKRHELLTRMRMNHYVQGHSQDFHEGGVQLDGEVVIVRGKAAHGGWVREGDVPPPAKGGSFWHF